MVTKRRFLKLSMATAAGTVIAPMVQISGAIAPIARVAPAAFGPLAPFAEASCLFGTQTPLSGKAVPKYVEPMPVFGSSDGVVPGQVNAPRVTGTSITVSMSEVPQKVLPASLYSSLPSSIDVKDGVPIDPREGTRVWAYKVGDRPVLYPGVTIEAQQGVATDVRYVNDLPASGSVVQKLITVDESIHWAAPTGDPMMVPDPANPAQMIGNQKPYSGPPPTVAHLHGAEVKSDFDGGPDQWFTSDGAYHGKGYRTFDADTGQSLLASNQNYAVYHYLNEQEGTTLWFHDHTLGATRLNVYAGMAAFYLLRDQWDTGQPDNPLRLPAGAYEREIAIQDRQFDTNGQLYWPDSANTGGFNETPSQPLIHPNWLPEFFGDVMVVNGKSWPFFEVEPRRYRFRLLDGCNARFLELRLMNKASKAAGPAFWVIGTDGGLLDAPVKLNDPAVPANKAPRLLMAPGERYDVIVDFAGFAGQTLTLVNSAKAPYPMGASPDPQTTGEVMQFRVTLPLQGTDTSFNPAAAGAKLRGGASQPPAIIRFVNPTKGTLANGVKPDVVRQLTLVEVEGPAGPEEVLVNNTKWDGLREGTEEPVDNDLETDEAGNILTETPQVGSTEVWEIVNTTGDAHPIHLHLVQFQLINRQAYQTKAYRTLYDSLFPGGQFFGTIGSNEATCVLGDVTYPAGVFIPGYGPPRAYDTLDAMSGYKLGGNPDVTPFLQDGIIPPGPEEAGWKDTVKMYPGQVTRIAVRFAPQDAPLTGTYKGKPVGAGHNLYAFDPTVGPGYVWHCHIVDHEDNEMMRPFVPRP